jgi:hypothetical protein
MADNGKLTVTQGPLLDDYLVKHKDYIDIANSPLRLAGTRLESSLTTRADAAPSCPVSLV